MVQLASIDALLLFHGAPLPAGLGKAWLGGAWRDSGARAVAAVKTC
jgi:hypothetical protein